MTALRDHTELLPFDARDALAVTLRLAVGQPRPEDTRADWSLVFDAASQEMLAALAWSRSRLFIRRHANDDIAQRWRRAALAAQLRGERQLDLLHNATAALKGAGVEAIVLKGLPLGEQLYGDPFVRCSADIDLFVPASQRARASDVLRRLGWRSTEGGPPWHECWSTFRGETEYHLELHSLLVCDHLAHVDAPSAAATTIEVGGVLLQAHTGDFVPAYLAAHLATHQMPPLLWLVDLYTLWDSLSHDQRARARHAARKARLGHYLDWACARAALVREVASDNWDALGSLGFDAARRRDRHSIWRHLALASSPADRVRLIGAFLVPRRVRGSMKSFVAFTIARVRTRLRSLGSVSRAYGQHNALRLPSNKAARGLRVERDDLLALTRDVVGAGGTLHVRAPGGSMMPTIPRGALVRIAPVPANGVTIGDVVLALTSDGEPVLHRAISISHDTIVMRGDAAIHVDPPVPPSRVIGVGTHVLDGNIERELGRRPMRSFRVSALKMRRRLSRMVRRAR